MVAAARGLLIAGALLAALGVAQPARAQKPPLDPCADEGYVYCNCDSKPHPRFYPITNTWSPTYDGRQDALQEHFDAGRLEEALRLAEALTTENDPCRGPAVSAHGVANYGLVLAAAGRLEEARAELERALGLFERDGSLDRARRTCTPRAALLLTNLASLEHRLGAGAEADGYEAWAHGCSDRPSAPPARPSALPPGAGCACELPAPRANDSGAGGRAPSVGFGVLLGLGAWRRRSRPRARPRTAPAPARRPSTRRSRPSARRAR